MMILSHFPSSQLIHPNILIFSSNILFDIIQNSRFLWDFITKIIIIIIISSSSSSSKRSIVTWQQFL
jgi:hypothetical protein